jgi:hypothetical protein
VVALACFKVCADQEMAWAIVYIAKANYDNHIIILAWSMGLKLNHSA